VFANLFSPYLAILKIQKTGPVTLKFNRVRAVVKVHVHAKFHGAKCSSSQVIVVKEKKTQTKTKLSVTTAESKK